VAATLIRQLHPSRCLPAAAAQATDTINKTTRIITLTTTIPTTVMPITPAARIRLPTMAA